MKISVSIPDVDVDFLDAYVRMRTHGVASRSSALRRAIRLLRASELTSQYADAFAEWEDSAESDAWDAVAADGLTTQR